MSQRDIAIAPAPATIVNFVGRSLRNVDAVFHSEFKPWISAHECSGPDENNREVEKSVDQMFEKVEEVAVLKKSSSSSSLTFGRNQGRYATVYLLIKIACFVNKK
jgi:hypothetical protein